MHCHLVSQPFNLILNIMYKIFRYWFHRNNLIFRIHQKLYARHSLTQIFICPTNSFYNFECKAFWLPREQLILYIFLISRTWLVVWMYAYYVSNLLPSCCEEPTVIACTDEACLSQPWIVYIKLTDCSYS